MALLGNLLVNLRANAEKYVANMERARQRTRQTEKTARDLKRTFVSMGKAALAAAGVAGIGTLVRSSLQGADAIQKLQQRIGGTTEELSALRHVFELSSVSFEQGAQGLQRMTRRIDEAARGTGEAKNALRELDLNAQALAKMEAPEQFLAVADALSKVDQQGRQTALAMKLFDSEGVKLLQTMQGGAEGMKTMMAEAKRLGLVMSQEQVDGAVAALDAITRLKGAVNGLANTLAVQLAPHIEGVANFLGKVIPASVKFAVTAFQTLRHFALSAAITIAEAFESVLRQLELSPKVRAAMETLADIAPMTVGRPAQALIDMQNAIGGLGNSSAQTIARMRKNLEELQHAYAVAGNETVTYTARKRELLDLLKSVGGATAEVSKEQKRLEDQMKSTAATITRDVETAHERHNRQMAEAEKLLHKNLISAETYWRQINKLAEELHNAEEAGRVAFEPAKAALNETQRAAQRAGDTIADAFANAARTGKLEFSDMVSSILTDMARLMMKQQLNPLMDAIVGGLGKSGGGTGGSGLLGGLVGSLASGIGSLFDFLPGRASGGALPAGGGPVVVGEEGPELLVGARGHIVPNDQMGGGRTVNITFNVNALDGASVVQVLTANRRLISGLVAGEMEARGQHSALSV